MREEVEEKLDNLIDLLDKDSRIINITNLKDKVINSISDLSKGDKLSIEMKDGIVNTTIEGIIKWQAGHRDDHGE